MISRVPPTLKIAVGPLGLQLETSGFRKASGVSGMGVTDADGPGIALVVEIAGLGDGCVEAVQPTRIIASTIQDTRGIRPFPRLALPGSWKNGSRIAKSLCLLQEAGLLSTLIGYCSLEQLRAEPSKVDYFHDVYSKMHRKILAHPYFVASGNIDELRGFDFVFLAFEGRDKRVVIDRLVEFGIPFIDVGMGMGEDNGSLNGILRVTTATPSKHDHLAKRVDGADAAVDDEYATNIQVADLNALNAALAVIKWKKLFGFYSDLEHEHHSTYMTDGNNVVNEDHA